MGASREHNSIAFGIKHDSILNSSQYFHVTEGLVPDIMHDVLEGSLAYEIKELIKYLVSKKILTIACINSYISNFSYYGADARNKPSPIGSNTLSSSDHGLRQSGKAMHIQKLNLLYSDCYSYTDMVPCSTSSFNDWRESM